MHAYKKKTLAAKFQGGREFGKEGTTAPRNVYLYLVKALLGFSTLTTTKMCWNWERMALGEKGSQPGSWKITVTMSLPMWRFLSSWIEGEEVKYLTIAIAATSAIWSHVTSPVMTFPKGFTQEYTWLGAGKFFETVKWGSGDMSSPP
jgi:hypothetical protein